MKRTLILLLVFMIFSTATGCKQNVSVATESLQSTTSVQQEESDFQQPPTVAPVHNEMGVPPVWLGSYKGRENSPADKDNVLTLAAGEASDKPQITAIISGETVGITANQVQNADAQKLQIFGNDGNGIAYLLNGSVAINQNSRQEYRISISRDSGGGTFNYVTEVIRIAAVEIIPVATQPYVIGDFWDEGDQYFFVPATEDYAFFSGNKSENENSTTMYCYDESGRRVYGACKKTFISEELAETYIANSIWQPRVRATGIAWEDDDLFARYGSVVYERFTPFYTSVDRAAYGCKKYALTSSYSMSDDQWHVNENRRFYFSKPTLTTEQAEYEEVFPIPTEMSRPTQPIKIYDALADFKTLPGDSQYFFAVTDDFYREEMPQNLPGKSSKDEIPGAISYSSMISYNAAGLGFDQRTRLEFLDAAAAKSEWNRQMMQYLPGRYLVGNVIYIVDENKVDNEFNYKGKSNIFLQGSENYLNYGLFYYSVPYLTDGQK